MIPIVIIIIAWIFVVVAATILLLIYWFRNNWVCDKRIFVTHQCWYYNTNKIQEGTYDQEKIDVDSLEMWDYHKMVKHFWIRDVFKMTRQPERFELVMNYEPTEAQIEKSRKIGLSI